MHVDRRWLMVLVSAALVAALVPLSAGAVTVPDPLPAGAPGDLIEVEEVGSVAGGTRYRVLHHSRSVQGDDIAVSGLVFVPTSPAPAGGRPVLAWAHGTVGMADQCAPSGGGYDPEYLDDWLAAGYVVTATDYEGLGTPGRHPYLVGESEGRGVLDSVRVALQMTEADAANEIVLFGHSQGGHAAMFANELAPTYAPELQVRGTIAAAPASQLMAAWSIATSGPVVRAAVVMMGAGFAQSYPTLDLGDIYTDEAIARMGIVDTACQNAVAAAYADLSQEELVHTTPDQVPAWADAVTASEPGRRVGASPVLIVQGTEDDEVPYEATLSLSSRLCANGQPHELVVYEGESHSGIFDPGHDTMVEWAAARFAGATPPDRCDDLEPPPTPTPQPGTCLPSGTVTPEGLPAISEPAVQQVTTEATVVGAPFEVTASASVAAGGTITYVGRPGADLAGIADKVLEERVKPFITETYGSALANTAWVTMELTDVTTTMPLPDGTSPVGDPVVAGSVPAASAAWSSDGLRVLIPSVTVDSREALATDLSVTWQVQADADGPSTVTQLAGPLTMQLHLTIGITFFGSPLTGGITAPFACSPPTAPLAQTAVLAAATGPAPAGANGPSSVAAVPVAVAVTPRFTG